MKNNFAKRKYFVKSQYFLIYFTIILVIFLLLDHNNQILMANEEDEQPHLISSILTLPENGTAIVVDKKSQILFVYEHYHSNNKNNSPDMSIREILSFPCSTGEEYGAKTQQGDKKTPEGIYFLTDEYEDKYLSPVYGKKAFPTDYPHIIDRQKGKSGSSIWIHGTDKPLQPMSSNGCIALENNNIMELAKKICLNKTPLILTDQIKFSHPKELLTQKQQVEEFIFSWLHALQSGSYHEYLAFYSSSHMPDIFWWNKWNNLRTLKGKDEKRFSIVTEDMGIYQYQDLIVVIMELHLKTESSSILLGTRKLFLKKENNSMIIAGDVYQNKAADFTKEASPLIAAANELINQPTEIMMVKTILQNWLKAWSNKDLETYSNFYAPNFTGDGLSKQGWVNRKKNLADRYKNIQVSGEKFIITQNKNIMVVNFFQKYRATGFSTNGFKELKLVHIGGSWKIFQEIWKGK